MIEIIIDLLVSGGIGLEGSAIKNPSPKDEGSVNVKALHGFNYADAGLSFYGDGIVATAATIASKPDIVCRFVAATVRGMKDAFADPAAAGAIMHKIVPQVDATIAPVCPN